MATRKYKNIAMKQRSFYMDDETYALIERHAERLGTSNGTALRMLVRHELLEEAHEPAKPVPYPEPSSATVEALKTVDRVQQAVAETTGIILPPDNQETFKVPEKFREKGPRVPRVKHSDDDF